jgi:hypothetical protein
MALAPWNGGKIRTDEKHRQTGENKRTAFERKWEPKYKGKTVCKALEKVAAEIGRLNKSPLVSILYVEIFLDVRVTVGFCVFCAITSCLCQVRHGDYDSDPTFEMVIR